jgi:ribosomal protein S18 acetylase RimI-like enzyme
MSGSAGFGFAAYRPRIARERPGTSLAIIREPATTDLAACAAMIVSRTGGDLDARRERLASELANDDHHLLVAAVDHEVVGFGQVMPFIAQPKAPANVAPDGYYLVGLIVAPAWRRRGIGEHLTTARIAWVAQRADAVWYFANAGNGATLDLHHQLGFVEVSRQFTFPGVTFPGGNAALLRAQLSR